MAKDGQNNEKPSGFSFGKVGKKVKRSMRRATQKKAPAGRMNRSSSAPKASAQMPGQPQNQMPASPLPNQMNQPAATPLQSSAAAGTGETIWELALSEEGKKPGDVPAVPSEISARGEVSGGDTLWDLALSDEQAPAAGTAKKSVPPKRTAQKPAVAKKKAVPPKKRAGNASATGAATGKRRKGRPPETVWQADLTDEDYAEERERQKVRQKKRKKKRFRRRLLWGTAGLCVALVAAMIGFFAQSTRNDDLWLDLDQIPYKTETIIYYTDQQTGEIAEYTRLLCTQNKEYVEPYLMPQQLKNAFVAVEDKGFYSHNGVDLGRTVFAVLNEVKHAITGSYIGGDSGRRQGASTIDQQLIKNLTRDDEDSNMAGYLRKLREIYRAYRLDADYDKDTILSAYLNTISFTGNTAGVQAEAKKLFGKTVDQLSLAECASLAAITRNPARYNPNTNPENHVERRNYVLQLMLEQGFISQAEHDEAVATPLWVTGDTDLPRPQAVTSYFTDALMDEVIGELVNNRGLSRKEASNLLYNGGLRIYATVVPELQQSMEKTLESGYLYPRPTTSAMKQQYDEEGNPLVDEDGNYIFAQEQVKPQAAMISLDYEGGVCAVVGGLGEKEISRGFNRGTSAVRQVGSTMKPIGPYICALEKGAINWSTPFLDAPVKQIQDENTGEMVDWPANVDKWYSQKNLLVREAFARSVNTVAVRVGEKAGNTNMYWFVRYELGIESFTLRDIDAAPLVLGSSTYGITPLDMAKAYAMFGNGGKVPTVHTFTRIANGSGGSLIENRYPLHQVIDESNAYIMNRLMKEVMRSGGTASGLSVQGEMESVGKTGTTSDNRDHWFIGLTPYYVTASWYGYDENLPLAVNNRQAPPVLAWRTVMQQAQRELPYREFRVPQGVLERQYCTVSGASAGSRCPTATGYYTNDNLPQSNCPVHG